MVIVLIFFLSTQNAEQPDGLSTKIIQLFMNTSEQLGLTDPNNPEKEKNLIAFDSRLLELVHIVIYFLFALILFLALEMPGISIRPALFIVLIACSLVAIVDEYNQTFRSGRGAETSDILNDMIGVVFILIKKVVKR